MAAAVKKRLRIFAGPNGSGKSTITKIVLMNEVLPDSVRCLDIEDSSRSRLSDDQVWQMIIEMVGVTNSSAFQVLEDKSKRMVLKELKDKGASYRQLERLTGVGRGLIQKL